MTPFACSRVGVNPFSTVVAQVWGRKNGSNFTQCYFLPPPVRFAVHGYLLPPPREGGISGLGYSSGLVPVISYHEMSGHPIHY